MPYQFDVARTWTDASTIHTIAEGVPTAGLFIPRRGSHSPVEVACVADIENAFRLVQAFLINLTCDSIDELRAQPTVRRE
jgi:putative aminopeptidase FrvX